MAIGGPAMTELLPVGEYLAHGTDMVLVDRIEQVCPGRQLHAFKAISGTEQPYRDLPAGLAPARYAYPASLVLESFTQAVAVLWHSARGRLADDERVLMFAAARGCRFEAAAYPGDVLRHEVEIERFVGTSAFATGSTWVTQRRIATMGSIIAIARPVTLLPPALVPGPP
jgi:3-hydroxyacyl-[acyl-carrier-protein] dehydratase